MMFKRHVLEKLSAYLDNQLSQTQKSKVEEHLKDCKVCSQELSRLKLLSEKLKAWQAPDVDSGFDTRVRNAIVSWELKRGEVKMKKKTLAILIPSGALAGILLIVFLGSFYLKRGIQGRIDYVSDKSNVFLESEEVGVSDAGAVRQIDLATTRSYTPTGTIQNWEPAAKLGYESYNSAPEVTTLDYSTGGHLRREGTFFNNGILQPRDQWSVRSPISEKPTEGKVFAYQTDPSSEGPVIVIQPTLPATGEGEKIIRAAQVVLEVEDGNQAYKKASDICKELGGYLAASNFYKNRDGRESGTITMRIPKDKFMVALERLRDLGKVENINTSSQDVSQEYANLKSRLDATMVVYEKMLKALEKRQTTIPEAMRLESELTPVLYRIEGLKNQIEYLNNSVSFTTVTINFHEPEVSAKVLKDSKRFILQSLLATAVNAVRFFARAIPVVVLLALWLGVFAILFITIKYLIIRIFKRKQ